MAKHLHERRRITFQEYGALLATRALLERNDLKFTPDTGCPLDHKHLFNMATKGKTEECGSIGCIGGTMAMIMGVNIFNYVEEGDRLRDDYVFGDQGYSSCSKSLSNLFYPPGQGSDDWKWIKPRVAVMAIDNWLATGKPFYERLKKAVTPVKARDYRIKRHK
jgi:hypothetical protein